MNRNLILVYSKIWLNLGESIDVNMILCFKLNPTLISPSDTATVQSFKTDRVQSLVRLSVIRLSHFCFQCLQGVGRTKWRSGQTEISRT